MAEAAGADGTELVKEGAGVAATFVRTLGLTDIIFGSLLGTGDKGSLFIGYIVASALMLVAAVVAALWGVDAEQESLEDVAEPLSATRTQTA